MSTTKGNLIYQGKHKLIALANEYVIKDDNGMDTDCVKSKMLYIKSLIKTLEYHTCPDSSNSIDCNFLYLEGKKIQLSPNNSYICTQEDQNVNVNDEYLNCLTEEELCNAALKLRNIINS